MSAGMGRVVNAIAIEAIRSYTLIPNISRWYTVENLCDDRAIINMTSIEDTADMHPVDLAMFIPLREVLRVSTCVRASFMIMSRVSSPILLLSNIVIC
jgi:hypothetical protein